MRMETKTKQKSLHHRLVEFSAGLWFHIIKWCYPKMVAPGADRPTLTPPSKITALPIIISVLKRDLNCRRSLFL